MRSWSVSGPPRLPGTATPLRLHDSVTDAWRVAPSGPTARMYVCGITPYDATHVGHAFTYVTFDLVNRMWRDMGLDVDYVQNVTDIDDPLLDRATARGEDWRDLAAREIEAYRQDMTALGVLAPRAFVGVVESVATIADLVADIRAAGAAYEVDGDIYFSADAAPEFGSVSGLDRATMLQLFAERGGDPERSGKKDPLDWLLWRAQRPDEPAWDSLLGRGRPGWHVECSAISLRELGPAFDLNGGGEDLLFPHHEMGAAEAHAVHPEGAARAYTHVAAVGLQGEKMSKSRGNLVFVSALRADGTDPMAMRLALLAHHYRSAWDWTEDGLEVATRRLERWRAAVEYPAGPAAAPVLAEVRAALATDLDTPRALDVVDAWIESVLADTGDREDPQAPALIRDTVNALLGVVL